MNTLFKTVTGGCPTDKAEDNVLPMPRQDVPSSQSVFVKEYELEMFIGVLAEEKTSKQRVIVSAALQVDVNPNWQNDEISDVLSYVDVMELIQSIADEGHINLVETFAERIAASCLQMDGVIEANVTVEKPDIFKNARSVGVTISRRRS